MRRIANGVLLFFAVAWILASSAYAAEGKRRVVNAEAAVTGLYKKVEVRAPSGLLNDADRDMFSPYLSKSLRRQMDLAAACEKDWMRKNPEQSEKAPFGWSEFGLFSGANERIAPGSFHIEKAQKDDGGFFRIDVMFTYRPGDGNGSWQVTDRVILENGRFVIDDVLFPKTSSEDSFTLSGRLSEGCKDGHWVGLR